MCIGAVIVLTCSFLIQAQSGAYSGRATGVIVLGPNAATAGDTCPLPGLGGTITMTTPASSLSGISTGAIVSSTTGGGTSSQSSATVNNVNINASGYRIRSTSVSANSQCSCCPGSVDAACGGRSIFSDLTIVDPAGNNVNFNISGAPNQVITLPNGNGTITINEQIATPDNITVNALHVNITVNGTNTNAIIASAHSDISCGIIFPTPSNVSVGGRIVDSLGRGLSSAFVSVTSGTGERYTASSNTMGYFKINDVPAGRSYVVEVSHRRYTFASRVVEVNADITDLVIAAQGP